MSDNITLPREVVKQVLDALEWSWGGNQLERRHAIRTLRTALAAPSLEVTVDPRLTPEEAAAISSALAAPKQEPTADDDDEEFTHEDVSTLLLEVMDWTYAKAHRNRPMTEAEQKVLTDIRTYLAAPSEDKTHPGYVIGSHWLETAYSRVCAGEAEADVLRDCGWERMDEILRRDADRMKRLSSVAAELHRQHEEIERLREMLLDIRKDALTSHWHRDIDAAMGEKR